MAVARLLFGRQFGEGFIYGGKEEQRIVAESVMPPRDIENSPFRRSSKDLKCLSIASGSPWSRIRYMSRIGKTLSSVAFTRSSGAQGRSRIPRLRSESAG